MIAKEAKDQPSPPRNPVVSAMPDQDRNALQDLLATIKPLASNGLMRPAHAQGGAAAVANQLVARWSTKQRLIERLLGEEDPRTALALFESRTQDFVARHPDTPGWRDKTGQDWDAALVIQACDEIRAHLDSWDAEDDFDDDDGGFDNDLDSGG